eukprot:TRINITY_DN14198_c0_g1_i1.p1 TRINITY_DN14198_c0_g1~~TRINITY_DN14198_c0_g1_i1.p1  ORF type:complete len:577 (-),score=196.86 TRINITY_DN14198_c0_g1_i1:89-1705(-)
MIDTGLPKDGMTDGSTENSQLFWDLPTGGRVAQMEVNLGMTYNGTDDAPDVYVFMRRYAPFSPGKDADYWVNKCLKAQQYPNSFNPYDCEMDLLTIPHNQAVSQNLTLTTPREGRYFLLFSPVGELEDNAMLSYTINVEVTVCQGQSGGPNCDVPVDVLTISGDQSSFHKGTVKAGEWKYWIFNVDEGVAEIQIDLDDSAATEIEGDGAYYLRFGNTPTYCNVTKALNNGKPDGGVVYSNLPCNTDWWFQSLPLTNWQNPYAGNYYIGVYGGEDGFAFDFKVKKVVCQPGNNGAYCLSPRTFNQCPTADARTCTSPDVTVDPDQFGKVQSLNVTTERWSYFHFLLPTNYYRVVVTAQIADYQKGDQVAVVVNPGGVPENNGENGDPDFKIGDIYVVSGQFKDDSAHALTTYYAAAGQGYFYVGFFSTGSNDRVMNVDWTVVAEECPGSDGSCDENGTCDSDRSQCMCEGDPLNPITCSDTPTPASDPDDGSSGGGGGLSTGSIVALSICIPLAVIIVIGIIAGGLYYVKFRGGYETIQ